MSTSATDLARLGWDEEYAAAFAGSAPPLTVPGRVVLVAAQTVTVITERDQRQAVLGQRVRGAPPPGGITAGDWVAVDDTTVQQVLPRRSALLRSAAGGVSAAQAVAANLDTVFIAAPLGLGVNARRLERSLAIAWSSGAQPVVLLTKADLSADLASDVAAAQSVAGEVEVIAIDSGGRGLDALRSSLRPRRTGAVVGPSGAGKSTLLNALCGEQRLATAPVRGDGRGRHTTSRRELVELPGGALLVDTPGMREMGVWEAQSGIDVVFSDLVELAARCRFSNCAHQSEPGCAVREAARHDPAVSQRLASLRKLEREQHFLDLQVDARLRADARREHRLRARALRSRPPR